MSVSVQFDDRAVIKAILHAARYPHASIIGLLAGTHAQSTLTITDAYPLTHNPISGPLIDQGLSQASLLSRQSIVGVYVAADANDRRDVHPTAQRLASQLADTVRHSVAIVVIDNNKLNSRTASHPFDCLVHSSDRWTPVPTASVTVGGSAIDRYRAMIVAGDEQRVTDFEAHIDDVTNDWTNSFVQ